MHPLLAWLDYCNTLWDAGNFYTAVLLYLPVQVGIVFVHNLQLFAVLVIGSNYQEIKNGHEQLSSR
jgi:hypothetical protein